jgi:hypothetical protein
MVIRDYCLLRHSNASFFGTADTSQELLLCNNGNVAQPELFMTQLGSLTRNLSSTAAYSSPRMFAVGGADVTPLTKVYARIQCTRDLAGDDCNRCLSGAISGILGVSGCYGKKGGHIFYRSCSVQYEDSLFYNATAAEAAMSPPAPAGGGPNTITRYTFRGTLTCPNRWSKCP